LRCHGFDPVVPVAYKMHGVMTKGLRALLPASRNPIS
jgi:hypothetical protein